MKREREGGFSIKSIASFDVGKIPGFLLNGNAGTVFLMILAATCHELKDKHVAFANGSVFLVLLGFLSLVVVEGKNLVSKWNKSGKRGFLTLGNIIGLVFLGVLLAVGMYAIFIIFYVKDFLTIYFLGVFGIIWTLRWIQKLKNFSSIRDYVHKLIGPLIAIVILISGYELHSKNTAFGPFSCVLAPATIWIFSLIFGDIKGRSNDQDDEINPFAIIISVILLGLVIYAIRNPTIYGIEVMDVDGEFFKDLYEREVRNLSSALEAGRVHLINKTRIDIKESIEKLETIGKDIDDLNKDLPSAQEQLEDAQREFEKAQKELTSTEKTFGPHQLKLQLLEEKIEKIKSGIAEIGREASRLIEEKGYQPDHPDIRKLGVDIADMNDKYDNIQAEIQNLRSNDNFKALEREFTEANNAVKGIIVKIKNANSRIDGIQAQIMKRQKECIAISANEEAKERKLKSLKERPKGEFLLREELKRNPHFCDRVEKLRKLRDTYTKSRSAAKAENTIISWFKGIFRKSKEINEAK